MKLRETYWQWGHPEGCYNNDHGNTRAARMTPMEGCLYLGIQKTFMVPDICDIDAYKRRQYNMSFETLKEVAWQFKIDYQNGIRPEQADPLIEEAKECKNITAVVLDDFVKKGQYVNLSVESLWALRDHLHENGLQMWMVLYTEEFGFKKEEDEAFQKYIEPFDGIIMWNWRESEYPEIPEKFEIFKEMTRNKRRMVGCYLYNFGQGCPATGSVVKWQLDLYRKWQFDGEIEGVVLHTNALADVGYEAYAACREWMAEHGDDEIPE